MFLFGGGSKKSKRDKRDEEKSRESEEIRDLKRRAKDAQRKRGDSQAIESVMFVEESNLEFRKSNTHEYAY